MPEESAASLLRIEEQLRQERETFNQRKEQSARWFALQLRMAYVALVLLPVIVVVCFAVLLNHELFPGTVVASAGAALFVDVLGIVGTVWKVVLGEPMGRRLAPITDTAGTGQEG